MDFARSESKVLGVISNSEGLTQGQIARIAGMPKRTVRFAIWRLKKRRLIREFLHEDARMSQYSAVGRGLA